MRVRNLVARDGLKQVATGTWANSTSERSACFTAKSGRYVRLRALSEVNGGAWTSAASRQRC